METTSQNRVHTIDAAGKRLGIVATEAAHVLLGKDQPDFVKNLVAPVTVTITNASKLDIPENRKAEIYQTYSGYPGGRRAEPLEHLGKRLGYSEVVRRTIGGMLANTKLKKPMLKNLVITE
ncbi:uL13 family ribosomal protein [Candidatus Saccharibacteria bacterium]|nr:uL13 family ribosomal protein [Candidatus Saccharibacteria bacterium]